MADVVYVVTGEAVSGDTFGPFVFNRKPTVEQQKRLIRERCDWAEPNGPGAYGSYTYLKIRRVVVESA